ncbi:MAG TPA: ABC transporter permease, partial [Massilia sp.]|nr:ABC transporter permease [Massilia sp.]
MQNTLFFAAAFLYAACALLPSRRGAVISGVTALAWLVHGAALWSAAFGPGSLRIGFAIMLSSALWGSVAAYWVESRNFALD